MVGGLGGALVGALAGPFSMFASMWLEHVRNGTTFLGLELIAAPIIGAEFGVLEGMAMAALWGFMTTRPRRLTIGWLMIAVAISGPMLALIWMLPTLWLVIHSLSVAVLLAILVMGAIPVMKMRQEEIQRQGKTAKLRLLERAKTRLLLPEFQDKPITSLTVRLSDWDDPFLTDPRIR